MDRMIQLRYLHQMYYTPVRLLRMRKRYVMTCHKCLGDEGTFLHMIWECTKIRPWSMVTEFIADKFNLPNICSPLHCLLGIFEQDESDVYTKLFLRIPYFGVWKKVDIYGKTDVRDVDEGNK